MIASNVAKRYARAFFDVAASEDRYEQCYRELKQFSDLLEGSKELREFLSNPVFELIDKKTVVNKVLQKLNLSPSTANCLRLLVDKRRVNTLREIEENYRKLMDNALGIARVQVKTAFPLTSELSADLKRSIEVLIGKKVDMAVVEDKSLLGGIVVRAGDKLYDGSVKMQLNNMIKLLGS